MIRALVMVVAAVALAVAASAPAQLPIAGGMTSTSTAPAPTTETSTTTETTTDGEPAPSAPEPEPEPETGLLGETTTTTATSTSLVGGELGLAVSAAPGALAPFSPGEVATAGGTLSVTSPLSGWTLQVSDGNGASPARGHLLRGATCTAGVANPADPLRVTATPSSGTSAGQKPLSATPTTLATGPPLAVATAVGVAFEQAIGPTEVLEAGCTYSVTVAYTLS